MANTGDEIHELLMGGARPGTTDADVTSYFASGSTDAPAYATEAALRGVAAMSPGRVVYLRYDRLPAGPYVLLCWAGDDETGVPHVYEGMHAVVSFDE